MSRTGPRLHRPLWSTFITVGEIGVQPAATLGEVFLLPLEFVTNLPDARQEFGAVATRVPVPGAGQDVPDHVGRQTGVEHVLDERDDLDRLGGVLTVAVGPVSAREARCSTAIRPGSVR